MADRITIRLSDRRPVSIDPDKWPRVGYSFYAKKDSELETTRTWELNVRMHSDGRAIVYGKYSPGLRGSILACVPIESRVLREEGYYLPVTREQSKDVYPAVANSLSGIAGVIGAPGTMVQACLATLESEALD